MNIEIIVTYYDQFFLQCRSQSIDHIQISGFLFLNLENMLNLSMQLDSKQQRKCMKDEFDYLHVLDLFFS